MTENPFLSAAIAASSEEALLSEFAGILMIEVGADACDILLADRNGALALGASTTAPEFSSKVLLGRGVGVSGLVVQTQQPLFIEEGAERHQAYAKYPGLDDDDCEGAAVLPWIQDGEVFAVCFLRREARWPMNAKEKKRLLELSREASQFFSAFRNSFRAGALTNRLGALSEVSKTIATSPYMEEILQLLVNLTAQQFNYTVCTVRLLDTERNELVLRATQSSAKDYRRKRAIKVGESIAGRAIVDNRPIIVPDVQTEVDYIGHDLAVQQNLRSMICVPLTLQDKPIGAMSCYTSEVRTFPADEIQALETLAKQAAVSIEHAKLAVRSTLLQEMHHRVKNSLQQVVSLLRLQLRQSHYKSLEEAIGDTLSRILAISSVHDLLSREDLDTVGIRSIAEMLVQHQQHSLLLPDRQITFQVRGDDVRLSMTHATQVALLLNELIQNAVEHGFHNTVAGEVHVTVEYTDGEVSLWVSDSGDPLPEGFDAATNSHLGMQIVENLCRGLGGKFKISDVLGWTVAEVKFCSQGSE